MIQINPELLPKRKEAIEKAIEKINNGELRPVRGQHVNKRTGETTTWKCSACAAGALLCGIDGEKGGGLVLGREDLEGPLSHFFDSLEISCLEEMYMASPNWISLWASTTERDLQCTKPEEIDGLPPVVQPRARLMEAARDKGRELREKIATEDDLDNLDITRHRSYAHIDNDPEQEKLNKLVLLHLLNQMLECHTHVPLDGLYEVG